MPDADKPWTPLRELPEHERELRKRGLDTDRTDRLRYDNPYAASPYDHNWYRRADDLTIANELHVISQKLDRLIDVLERRR